MFLPQLGGRIQRAIDKTNNYDFVYYNHVIKPALVGLTGPWISGGIEFNWPQHHRPTTYAPTEYQLTENPDGSCSLRVAETDQMYGTKGSGIFTLYPGKAYIEIKGQLYNPTELPQTFLWWANPAVPVNDHTVSIFPPDVTAVLDHGKRAVSTFPIATGEYYKVDYSAGVDISMYKNIPAPTSYMAEKSAYDFIGNYDEQLQAGLLHVADHHVSPGKKQWTWGNGEFGRAWDRNLTDEDGPYIELMTGVYTDNQPDFTWLRPYEEKVFTQYFMPYKGVGRIKNATKEAAVNLEHTTEAGKVLVYASQVVTDGKITVSLDSEVVFEKVVNLNPAQFVEVAFSLPETVTREDLLKVAVTDAAGKELVSFQEVAWPEPEIPEPAEAIPAPSELATTEELFLAATHLEQYRHATSEPADYYEEGLCRDATDIRLNNGYGTLLYRRGELPRARQLLETAVRKQTWKTPNPYYGEPLFQLGLTLEMLGEDELAYDRYYKAAWNEDTQGAAFYKLACFASRRGGYSQGLDFVRRSLVKNNHHMKGRMLEILLMERCGADIADKLAAAVMIDPLDYALNRKLGQLAEDMTEYYRIMRGALQNYLTLSLFYKEIGFVEEALAVLEEAPANSPLVGYYQAAIHLAAGEETLALAAIARGEAAPADYCFPNRLEEMVILQQLIAADKTASHAKYYLGNLLYDKKQYDAALALWEEAAEGWNDFPTIYRNLAVGYYNKKNNPELALSLMNKAWDLDQTDARILLEKTQLEGLMKVAPSTRLQTLEAHLAIVSKRDDLFLAYVTLLNTVGRHQEALTNLQSRIFHPWEGGEGKVATQYKTALIALAQQTTDSSKKEALLLAAKALLDNLGEGKLPTDHDNQANLELGRLYRQTGQMQLANQCLEEATKGLQIPGSVLYYNDESADLLYYQGLALQELGHTEAAMAKFDLLLDYGRTHLNDKMTWDFFAVSAPAHSVFDADIDLDNRIYCLYLLALGYLGKSELSEARRCFEEVLTLNPAHQAAKQQVTALAQKIQ